MVHRQNKSLMPYLRMKIANRNFPQETGLVVHNISEYSFEGVRFLYKEGNSDRIIVTFSAFPPRGVEQSYNYLKKFKDSNCTFLSFLDQNLPGADPRGTYYLDRGCGTSYLETINMIIHLLIGRFDKRNVFLLGSSKGGVGAMLFGLKFGYPNIIINAPQARIATYIKRRSREIINFMAPNLEMFAKLDSYFLQEILQAKRNIGWNIHITCGEDDRYHLAELALIQAAFNAAQVDICVKYVRGGHDNLSIWDYIEYFMSKINLTPIYE